MTDRHPKDPRVVFPNHRERGPRACRITYEDIARSTGLTKGTVIKYAAAGHLDLADVDSVIAFLRATAPGPLGIKRAP